MKNHESIATVSVIHPINQSIDASINQSIRQLINQSINQRINRRINVFIDQPTSNQAINDWCKLQMNQSCKNYTKSPQESVLLQMFRSWLEARWFLRRLSRHGPPSSKCESHKTAPRMTEWPESPTKSAREKSDNKNSDLPLIWIDQSQIGRTIFAVDKYVHLRMGGPPKALFLHVRGSKQIHRHAHGTHNKTVRWKHSVKLGFSVSHVTALSCK